MKTKQLIGLIVVMVLVLIIILLARAPGDDAGARSSMLSQLVTAQSTDRGWQHASPDYAIQFPADHQSHPQFAVEWWYLTANLKATGSDRHYGVQFTLFRRGLSAEPAANSWQAPHLYMAHMAVTDSEAGQHLSAQRFSRPGPGLAGSSVTPLALWLESWRLQAVDEVSLFPAVVEAADHEKKFGYRLSLTPLKPVSLQGEQGFSRKGAEGGASHYYSYTRLAVEGELQVGGDTLQVNGQGWFDHEWTSATLGPGQAGWDWFSLQLDDGRDLTLFRLRGDNSDWQAALVGSAGERLPLESPPTMKVIEWWTSDDGVRYPLRWQLQLKHPTLALEIQPTLADQEMNHIIRYWEGAVRISGSHSGVGYMELTGYEDAM